jgi:hypothetical protein
VLLCAPSLGILDNWLPVLHAARASHPDWRIVALIPDRETLSQLDPSDTAHVLADEVIDATVAPLVGGGWVEAAGFLAAARAAAPRRWLPPLPTVEQFRRRTQPRRLARPEARLLYDIHLHEKNRIAPLLATLGDIPRFSHNHGLELEVIKSRRVAPFDPYNVTAAFLYGPSEIEAYARNFGLAEKALCVVGIVRHEPAWVKKVIDKSAELHHLPFDEFALVISRPAGSSYLPRERKIRALSALHEVMWEEHRVPLVFRTHPKEHDDGTFAVALPKETEGLSWVRSGAHPFHLATQSRIGITFLSGVAIDLVALGVPVIELLDVRGLPEHDNSDTRRDKDGRILFGPYRGANFVVPADDFEDLRGAAARILNDRLTETSRLSREVQSRISRPPNSTARMLSLLSGG